MTGLVRHDACTTLGPGTRASTTTGTAAAAGSPALAAGTRTVRQHGPGAGKPETK